MRVRCLARMAEPTDRAGDESTFIRRVLIVIALVGLALFAWQLRDILLMIFGAVVVATLLRSFADLLCRWLPMPAGVALLLSVLIVVAIVGLIAFLFGAQLVGQAETLRSALPQAWESARARLGEYGIALPAQGLARSSETGGLMANAGQFIMSVGGALTDTLLILVGGIFLAGQPSFYRVGAIKLVPEASRSLVAEALGDSGRALKLWLKAQLLAMVLIGVLTGLGLWLLGVPSALALGLLAGFLEFIPFVGPILSAIPAVLLALAIDPQLAIWTVVLYVIIQHVEGYAIQPIIQQWAVDLPGFVLLFALLACGALFGPMGVIFAAPLTVVSYVLVKRLYVREALDTPTPIPGEDKDAA